MLSQLTIRNFAIVDHLEVDWQAGLNVITGETGAGKSILIDAVGALLGDRLGPEVVRAGAQRALVEGIFTLPESVPAELAATLDEFGLEAEDGALIVSRELAGSGSRGGARINGRGVPVSVLGQLGECLVDIHGQSEHMALLRPREQLEYLDLYAGVLPERAEVGRLLRELRVAQSAHEQLLATERETARLEDRLRHEIGEIERASLAEDEEAQLQLQRARLEHVQRLRQAALTALAALGGESDAGGNAAELLAIAVAACEDGGRIDAQLANEADLLRGALEQTRESASALRDYVESLEADPQVLDQTMERLFLIADLKRKYGDSVREVLRYADDARLRLAEIQSRSDRIAELASRARELEAALDEAARALSTRRREAASALAEAVQHELRDLRVADALFGVSLETCPVDVRGIDRVEFLLGADARPIARVASGGELARIALALKTVLTRAETRPTLIFDEVDAGVGGRTGPVVGEKLWAVAAGGHQVLCVTHLPQVAAFGDAHYAVSRSGGAVGVRRLEGDERVDELAAMMAGGLTPAARQSAQELLARAGAKRDRLTHPPTPSLSVSEREGE